MAWPAGVVEHIEPLVYGGIFVPDHPVGGEDGLRSDVLELVRELGVSVVRYPGGNFASGYRWEDGVGRRSGDRPVSTSPGRAAESNAFGLHEFMRWAGKAGVEPLMTLNLGTRGVAEALDLLEYANHPRGSELSERRIAHGALAPFGIRRWCLGNELDGAWQLGHKTASEYGRLAAETARAMRQYDPTLRLVACGSSSATMPTFGEWERLVLEETSDLVDAILPARLLTRRASDLGELPGVGRRPGAARIERVADHRRRRGPARRRRQSASGIAVDEWNVSYMSRHLERPHPTDWPRPRPLRGRLFGGRCGGRGQPAHLAPAARRPRIHGLPRAAREQHRAHQDGAPWPRLA